MTLPDTLHVIVRDWHCANHVLFRDPGRWTLVDAGHVSHAGETLRLVDGVLGGDRLDRIVLTHCHSDHMGGCASLQRAHGCRIAVPAGEAPLVENWDTEALWLDYAGQSAERFRHDEVVHPGDRMALGALDWDVVAAPGHDMGAVAFWCRGEGILVSGDALWERGFGIVMPGEGWRDRLAAARDTLLRFAGLAPRIVIPGHGEPFTGVGQAVEACLARIDTFERDESRLARHVLRVMAVYLLMDQGSVPREPLVQRLGAIPMFEEYGPTYFGQDGADLARGLVEDLLQSGVIVADAGDHVSARDT